MELPKIGDRVKVDGWDGDFIVVEVNAEKNSASLLPLGPGLLIKNIRVGNLHGHHLMASERTNLRTSAPGQ